jgi:hypothetical protein
MRPRTTCVIKGKISGGTMRATGRLARDVMLGSVVMSELGSRPNENGTPFDRG